MSGVSWIPRDSWSGVPTMRQPPPEVAAAAELVVLFQQDYRGPGLAGLQRRRDSSAAAAEDRDIRRETILSHGQLLGSCSGAPSITLLATRSNGRPGNWLTVHAARHVHTKAKAQTDSPPGSS